MNDDSECVRNFIQVGVPLLKILLRANKTQQVVDPLTRFQENLWQFCHIRIDIKDKMINVYLNDRLVCTELI